MTKAAYAAVMIGVTMMVLLTINPAYEAAHRWVDGILWACLAFFAFEWAVKLYYAFKARRGLAYLLAGRGILDTACVLAVPIALLCGASSQTAWLLAVLWLVKVIPGVPGLRRLRRVLVLESGPLLSVLAIDRKSVV